MYEVVESAGEWILRCAGREVGRYPLQAAALAALGRYISSEKAEHGPVSFAMRFDARSD